LATSVGAALAGSTSLRLELERRAWLRLGQDVVGQRTVVAVAKNRYGPPGRSVELDIHYLAEGERSVATHRLGSADLATLSTLAPAQPTSVVPVRPLASAGPAAFPVSADRPAADRPAPRLVVV
jgi:hypothetical protein